MNVYLNRTTDRGQQLRRYASLPRYYSCALSIHNAWRGQRPWTKPQTLRTLCGFLLRSSSKSLPTLFFRSFFPLESCFCWLHSSMRVVVLYTDCTGIGTRHTYQDMWRKMQHVDDYYTAWHSPTRMRHLCWILFIGGTFLCPFVKMDSTHVAFGQNSNENEERADVSTVDRSSEPFVWVRSATMHQFIQWW